MLVKKIVLVCVYCFIILLIPLFLDFLLKKTVREKKLRDILKIAKNDAIQNKKSLIVFNGTNGGTVYSYDDNYKQADFSGNFGQIIDQLESDSCIVVVCYTLEYIDDLHYVFNKLLDISGNNLYVINFEQNSLRAWWDYKFINIFNKSYLIPSDFINTTSETYIKIVSLSNQQLNIHNIYKFIFKIVPYSFFIN